MADKKAPPPKATHPATPVIIMFVVATILAALVVSFERFLASHSLLADFLATLWLFVQGKATFAEVVAATGSPFVASGVLFLKILSFIFSVCMVWVIVWTYRKYSQVEKKLKAPTYPPKEIFYGVETKQKEYVNPKWAKVLAHVNSTNPSDWRLAILEADIILNEMLDKMGYHGATMGDKLKSIEPSDFSTLQEAWEAHKVRNAIAHEGSDLNLNKAEAERVVRLFEKVFKEFKFI